MKFSFLRILFLTFAAACLFLDSEARHHKHMFKRHRHHKHDYPSISLPPSPQPDDPADAPTPSVSSGVFDVRSFGAVGDGVTDDTEAFKEAWDAACSCSDSESAVLHAPVGYTFMIQSTIFTLSLIHI